MYQAEFRSVLLLNRHCAVRQDQKGAGVMEQFIVVVVGSVVGITVNKTAKWGIAALKAKGVKVPTWVERVGPGVLGTVAGLGVDGAEQIVTGHDTTA